MKTRSRSLLAWLLVLTMVIGMLPASVIAITPGSGDGIGISKGSQIGTTGLSVTSLKTYNVAPNVKEYNIISNNSQGTSQTVSNVVEVKPGGTAKAVVGYGNVSTPSNWKLATTTEQCHEWEKVTGQNVVAGINAAWFNITTGEPSGAMVINGQPVKADYGMPYFASYSDGSASIEHAGVTFEQAAAKQSEKLGYQVTVTGAVAAVAIMVENGQLAQVEGGNGGYYSRSCVGIKADGTIVLFQADGTMAPRSVGFTAREEAEMMIELGCEIVLQLDEGGSSTIVTQREGEDDVTMRNTPAGGSERGISSTILIVSDVSSTGEFDHANITPNENYYTPGSTVELSAVGIDNAGAEALMIPESITWKLVDESMGTLQPGAISGNKAAVTFVSSGKLGEAKVQMMDGDKVVGTATVNIQNPDELSFGSNEVALNYGDKSDLGLVAKYQHEVVNLKVGDVEWEMVYADGYDSANYPIGTLVGLTFTATSNTTVSCTVTVHAKIGELTATTSVALGKEPSIVADGGDTDGREYDLSTVNTVSNIASLGEKFGICSYWDYGRGGIVSGSVIENTNEEYADIIRFGTKAIRIDYDWTQLSGTDGACIGPGNHIPVDGSPTAVGVWVYIPDENTPVPWLRMQIATSTDDGASWTNAYINFISDSGVRIDGEAMQVGWNYIEADLSSYVAAGTKVRVNGGMLLRAMVTTSGIGWRTIDGTRLDKSQLKGYIIVDNISFVYGSNNQDITAPSCDSLSFINSDGSKTEIENGMIVSDYKLNFYATHSDHKDTDPFATGVESAYFYIDGIYYGRGTQDNLGNTLLNVCLPNGQHSVTMYLKDGYGNITRDTRWFIVDNDDAKNDFTSVNMQIEGIPTVGEDWHVKLIASELTNIKSLTVDVSVVSTFPVTDVIFPAGVTGTYTYNAAKRLLKLEITAVAPDAQGDLLADIVIHVPESTKQGASITISATKGMYALINNPAYYADDEHVVLASSFSAPAVKFDVHADYILSADTMIVGQNGTVYVEMDGQPAVNVDIYVNDVMVGTTNSRGELKTEIFKNAAVTYNVYAMDLDGNRSYMVEISSYNPVEFTDTSFHHVSLGVSKDMTTQQVISWLSAPGSADAMAKLMYSVNADMSGATTVYGKSSAVVYSASAMVSFANSVTLSKLLPGTTYYFQVGDGANWSEIQSFRTEELDPYMTRFFVLADIQEDEALAGFTYIANHIASTGKQYNFGLQTGDAVDNVRYYEQWDAALNLFANPQYAGMDWIHVLGNHEVDDGGLNGVAGMDTFGIRKQWYSVEYGDVYVAVLNHTMDEAQLVEFSQWLVEDAAKSDATWKIVTSHVPVYYTNPVGGGQVYHEFIRAAIEEAGIDFYFSGNDHSFARTTAMLNGEPNKDGTVYYICGSTGGKSYSVVENEDFHFDIATINFDSVYMDIEADEYHITVTAYNVKADGSATVLDTYTKRLLPLCENEEHRYEYNRANGAMLCLDCGHKTDMATELYSGYVTDKETGKPMYMVAGKPLTVNMHFDEDFYYADDNGLAYHGEYIIDGQICVFENGYFVKSTTADVMYAGRASATVDFILYADGSLKLLGSGSVSFDRVWNVPYYMDKFRPSITSIFVGKDIEEIGNWTFHALFNVTSVTFEEGSKLTKIGQNAFCRVNAAEIILPDGVTYIGYLAFSDCVSLQSLYIPSTVTKIENNALNKVGNVTLSVGFDSYAKQWAVSHNVNYVERDAAQFTGGACGENLTWELTEDGILTIEGTGAMNKYTVDTMPWAAYRNSIVEVNIGAGVTNLTTNAFAYCYNLETVNFAEGSAITKIEGAVFGWCYALREIVLPDGIQRISGNAFRNCQNLSVYVPDSVSFIDTLAFRGASNIKLSVGFNSYAKQWAISNGVAYEERESKVIAEGSCGENLTWNLTESGVLTIDGTGAMNTYTQTTMPWAAYRNQIVVVNIGAGVTKLSSNAFAYCYGLTKVVFAEGSQMTAIGGSVFFKCTALREIILPAGLDSISGNAFRGCQNLKIHVPETVIYIDAVAFRDATGITLVVADGSYAHQWAQANGVAFEIA